MPLQIPIEIRCKLNTFYGQAWQFLRDKHVNATDERIADFVNTIQNPYTKGVTLIAILEITLNDDGPLRGSSILTAVNGETQSLDCLTHSSEEELANLLATYVRVMASKMFRAPNEKSLSHQTIDNMLQFSRQIWNLCSPYYNVSISERPSLFAAVIRKLEGIEIAFSLWILLHALSCDATKNHEASIWGLYECMEDHFLNICPQREHPWVVPAVCTMSFLLLATRRSPDCPFFDLLHSIMKTCCGSEQWKSVWQISQQKDQFKRLLKYMHHRRLRSQAAWKRMGK